MFADETEEDTLARRPAEQELEFVVPRERSVNTAVALPAFRHGEVFVGLKTSLLPVPQRHEGDARILTAPAWRLGRDVTSVAAARAFVPAQLGVSSADVVPLGAAGITPERAHPFAVRIARTAATLDYDFVPLRSLRAELPPLRDGHLLVAALRLMHACSLRNAPD